MRLVKFEIGKGSTLEDAVIWGTSSLREYLKALDEMTDASEENDPTPRRMVFFFREIEHKLDEYLGKHDQYMRGIERQIRASGRVLS